MHDKVSEIYIKKPPKQMDAVEGKPTVEQDGFCFYSRNLCINYKYLHFPMCWSLITLVLHVHVRIDFVM